MRARAKTLGDQGRLNSLVAQLDDGLLLETLWSIFADEVCDKVYISSNL